MRLVQLKVVAAPPMGKTPFDLGLPIPVRRKGSPFIHIGCAPVCLKERAKQVVRPRVSLDAGYHHRVWHKDRKTESFEGIWIWGVSHLLHTLRPSHLRSFLYKICNVQGEVLNRLIDLNMGS